MRVDALLAQDRDLGRETFEGGRAGHLRGGEAAARAGPGRRIAPAAYARCRRRGLSRCWADLPADAVPHLVQVAQRRREHPLGVAPDLDLPCRRRDDRPGLADEVAVPLTGHARAAPASRRCARAVRTCNTTPSSSLNSAFSVSSSRRALTCEAQFLASPYSARLSLMPSPSVTSISTLSDTPTWPANAISHAAANRPPSLRSW